MASRCDEVEHHMDPVIPKSRVTLDTRLLGQDIVILTLEVSHYFLEATQTYWDNEMNETPHKERG